MFCFFHRWFLSQLGYDKTNFIFVSNGVAMAVTFFIVRIAVMPSYWHRVYSVYNTPAFNRLGYIQLCLIIPCIILDIINVYWFYKICVGAFRICCLFFEKEKLEGKSSTGSKLLNNTFNTLFTKNNHPLSHKHID